MKTGYLVVFGSIWAMMIPSVLAQQLHSGPAAPGSAAAWQQLDASAQAILDKGPAIWEIGRASWRERV